MSATRERSPDFLVIGAMKSGTTTLFEYLCRHPGVFMCTPKEPAFFSRDLIYERGIDWYRGLFAEAEDDQICGEASTCYSRWPHYGDVAGRIAQHLPDVKLIYLMRHPVDRAYSHYRHVTQEEDAASAGRSFEEAIEASAEILDASLYLRQLEQYLAHFPREQIFCLTLDDLHADPDGTLEPLQRFLGLDPVALAAVGPVEANAEGTGVALRSAQDAIRQARDVPVLSSLLRALPAGSRRRFKAWLKSPKIAGRLFKARVDDKRHSLSPLREETRAKLLEQFEEPTREIAAFLERDLGAWNR